MDTSNRTARSGGCLLALSLIAGVAGGTYLRQPSLGFLAGLGVGLMLLIGVWLLNRR